ncbi:MAG: MFS transporter [Vampirovibrionales bacterium]
MLKYLAFLRVFISQLLASLGDALLPLVFTGILLQQHSEVGAFLSLLYFYFVLPSLMSSVWAGQVADTIKPIHLLQLTAWGRVMVATLCVVLWMAQLVGTPTSTGITFTIMALLGLAASFATPARQKLLPTLIADHQLSTGNALMNGSSLLAVLAAGASMGYTFPMLPPHVWLQSILGLYFMAALCLQGVSATGEPHDSLRRSDPPLRQSIVQALKEVWRYLMCHRHTLYYVTFGICLSVVTSTFFNGMCVLATDYYKVGMLGLSKLKLMLGVGIVLGISLTFLTRKQSRQPWLLVLGFFLLFVATATVPFVTSYHLAWGWLVSIGMCTSLLTSLMDTMLQRITPYSHQGKIFGLRSFVATLLILLVTGGMTLLLPLTTPLTIFKGLSLFLALSTCAIVMFDARFRHLLLRYSVLAVFRVLFHLRIQGRQQIPTTGKLILAGNHSGWLDTLILQTACRRPIYFITGAAAFQIPIICWILPWFNVIPLNPRRPKEALDHAVKKLHGGAVVCIFPEGRLTEDGQLLPFNRGVMYMARQAQASIVPFGITGGFEAWGYGQKHPRLGRICIRFGESHTVSPPLENKEADKQLEKESLESLRLQVQQLFEPTINDRLT